MKMTPLEKQKPRLAAMADDWEKQENSIDSHEFYDKYKPVYNHIENPNSFSEGQTTADEIGIAQCFETYGEEWEYVKKQPDNKIWTVINTEGQDIICQGYHLVNRMHYMIATVPYKEGDKDFFIDWVDDINCHRCGVHADNKEDLLKHFFHRSDTWWEDDNYEIVCTTCRDEMKEENDNE